MIVSRQNNDYLSLYILGLVNGMLLRATYEPVVLYYILFVVLAVLR
jgi:hypothetical protein